MSTELSSEEFDELKEGIKMIRQIVHAQDLAIELFKSNEDDSIIWLTKEQEIFGGLSAFQSILEGNGEFVINWLKARLGHADAKAF